MNKKQKAFVLLLLVFLLIPSLTFAHAGKTDEFGGHYDYNTGEYHYHHGYPAHQHTDGICPYDFDDKTNHDSSSGSGSSSSNRSEYTTETTTERITVTTSSSNTDKKNSTSNKEDKKPMTAFTKFAIFYIVISLIAFAILIYWYKDELNNVKKIEEQTESLKKEIEKKDNTISDIKSETFIEIGCLVTEKNDVQNDLKRSNYLLKKIIDDNSIYELSHVPPDTKIYLLDDCHFKIEQKEYDGNYGKYTVYISQYGTKYHMRKDCSSADIPVYLFDEYTLGDRTPCSKCCKSLSFDDELLTEPEWLNTYIEIKKYYDTYLNTESGKKETVKECIDVNDKEYNI